MALPNPALDRASAREQFSLGKVIDTQYSSLVRSAAASEAESRVSDVRVRDADDKTGQLQSKNSSLLDTSYELVLEQNRLIREIIEAFASSGRGGPSSFPRPRLPRSLSRPPSRRPGPRRYGPAREAAARDRLNRMRESNRQRRVDRLRRMLGLGPRGATRDAAAVRRENAVRRDRLIRDNITRTRNITQFQRDYLRQRGITIDGFNQRSGEPIARRSSMPGTNERGRPFVSRTDLNAALDAARRAEIDMQRNRLRSRVPRALSPYAGGAAAGAVAGGLGAGVTDYLLSRAGGASREEAATGAGGAAVAGAQIGAGLVTASVLTNRIQSYFARSVKSRVAGIVARNVPIFGTALVAGEAGRRIYNGDIAGGLRAIEIGALAITGQALTGTVIGALFGVPLIASSIWLAIQDLKINIQQEAYREAYGVEYFRDEDPAKESKMQVVRQLIDGLIDEEVNMLMREVNRSIASIRERIGQRSGITQRGDAAVIANGFTEQVIRAEIERSNALNDEDRIIRLNRLQQAVRRYNRSATEANARNLENTFDALFAYDVRSGITPRDIRGMRPEDADRINSRPTQIDTSGSVPTRTPGQRPTGFTFISNDVTQEQDVYEFGELVFDAERIVFEGDVASSTGAGGGIMSATSMGAANPIMQASFTGGGATYTGGGGFYDLLRAQESGTNDAARNPLSTATGRYQFIESTWMQFARENAHLFAGMDRQQILASRNNPQLQEQAVRWYASSNASTLSRAGLPVNDATVALSHFLGVGGAMSVLRSDPNTPLEQILTAGTIAANPNVLRGRTAGQLVAMYAQRYGVGSSFAGGASQIPGTPAAGQDLVRRGTDADAETQRIRRQRMAQPLQQQSPPSMMPTQQQNDREEQQAEVPLRQRLLGLVVATA